MKKLFLLFIICASLLCTQAALAREHNLLTAVIDGKTADRVHLREGASADSKSLGLYFTGTELLREPPSGSDWVWVNIGTEGGYVKTEFLADAASPRQPQGLIHNPHGSNWVNLRHPPSLNGEAIGKLYNGDVVAVLGETATGWFYVETNGLLGYVSSEFIHIGPWDAYKAVLQNTEPFINEENEAMRLQEWINRFTDVDMAISHLAFIDLDGDGVSELVLRMAYSGNEYGSLVLHRENSAVYCYELVFRAFWDLKADGTFAFTSGAGDFGFGRLQFSKNAYSVEAFPSTDAEHANKADVAWRYISSENINTVISDTR